MMIKERFKKGLFIFAIYLLSAIFIFIGTDRIERLEKNTNSYSDTNFAVNFNK